VVIYFKAIFVANKVLLHFRDIVVAAKDLQDEKVDLTIVIKKAQTHILVGALNLKSP